MNSVHRGPEHGVVVFHSAPVLGSVGAGQVGAVFLQDVECCGQFLQ